MSFIRNQFSNGEKGRKKTVFKEWQLCKFVTKTRLLGWGWTHIFINYESDGMQVEMEQLFMIMSCG